MCTANHTYIPYIILCFPTKTYFLHIYANKDINVHTVQNVHRCMYNLLNRIYMLGRFRNCPIWRHNWLDKPKMPKLWKNNVNWDRVYHITKTVSGRSFKSFCLVHNQMFNVQLLWEMLTMTFSSGIGSGEKTDTSCKIIIHIPYWSPIWMPNISYL